MIYAVLLIIAFIGSVSAACDNQCSGHGYCTTDDVCKCYDNWGMGLGYDSGDCSERICPFEISWVDRPNDKGRFHKYLECAGRGICDRGSGECACFDGYEGKGCQRSTCPNDCSGHGTCEYIEDLAYGSSWGDFDGTTVMESSKTFAYRGWDSHKARGCVCDATYGDVDCSKRMCPFGTDVLDVSDNLLASQNKHQQEIILTAPSNVADGRAVGTVGFNDGRTFALTFKSKLNETFTTLPIVMEWKESMLTGAAEVNDMEHDIQLALLSLPNRVIDGVTVDCITGASAVSLITEVATIKNEKMTCTITFTGNAVQGKQNLLTVESYECHNGCTPKLSGLFLETITAAQNGQFLPIAKSAVVESRTSDYNSFECGRRGKCDYASGLCQCFLGYTGDNCNTLTTLV